MATPRLAGAVHQKSTPSERRPYALAPLASGLETWVYVDARGKPPTA